MARVKPVTTTQPLLIKKSLLTKDNKNGITHATTTKGRALHAYWILSKRVEDYEKRYLEACAFGASRETISRTRCACLRAQEDIDHFRLICKKKFPERMEFYSIDEIEMKNKYRLY